MIKQVLLPILGVIIFIIFVGMYLNKTVTLSIPGLTNPSPTPSSVTITIAKKTIQVQVAKTQDQRTKGLSGVSSLDKNSGMLFVFDTKKVNPAFWMKDMLIPLDMIWISNNKIVKIDKDIPAPALGTPNNKLTVYSPGQPVDYVLEVNAGFSNLNNLSVGSSVDLSSI